ncbi:hypothetical protein HAHE_00750 [Haloferula helveola]|uniref:HTH gntR-type domain-containing protein n=1 Tax=Haloferula helveola TaxID=490095 RepID=A0ABM7R8C8_9BACT|nr:hypothetical protein HAHE_00750 [Haloferula helveola]
MPALPQSKFAQLSELIRERIETGEWTDKLPSERILADEFLVSRTTLRRALEILTRDGLIEAPSARCTLRAIRKSKARRTAPTHREVCFLTPTLHVSPLLTEQIATMRGLFTQAGIKVASEESASLVDRRDPSAHLRRIVARHPDAMWVLHKMPESVQRWFQANGLPTVIFGSAFPEVSLPSVDVDFRAAAHHAAGLCLARGCRRIGLLIHRTPLAGDEKTVSAVSAVLTRQGSPAPKVMRHDSNRARLMDALDREFLDNPDACDALIVANHHHLLTVQSHLLHRGIRLPEQLSLVYLSNDPSAERLSPLPLRYESGPALIRRLVAAVKTLAEGGNPPSSSIIPKLLDGQTMRRATGPEKDQ